MTLRTEVVAVTGFGVAIGPRMTTGGTSPTMTEAVPLVRPVVARTVAVPLVSPAV